MAWTEEMVEELKRLWAEGVTTGEIGRRLNISKNSIVGKVHRLGLSGRPSPIKKKSDTTPAAKGQPAKEKSAKPAKKEPTTKTEAKPAKAPAEKKPVSKPIAKPEPKPQPVAETSEEDIKLASTLNIPSAAPVKKDFLSLTDLDNHTCRWPIGDPKDENFHFCGKKVRLGQTYCEEHSAIAYVSKQTKK